MTVIAFCDGVLASDTRCADGLDNTEVRKIWRLKNGYLFGGAGDAGFCNLVRQWLDKGADMSARPQVYGDQQPSFSGLLIRPDGQSFILDHYLGPIETLGGPQAVGSGAPHALSLMKTGMTAEQAVVTIIEKQLADGVGGRVMTLALKRRQKTKCHRRA